MSSEQTKAIEVKAERIINVDNSRYAMLLDTAKFEQIWRASKMYAAMSVVPDHYKGKIENCFLAINMAMQFNVDPFMLMMKSYVVGGKLAMEGQFIIAQMNARGPFTGPVQWKFERDGKKIKSCTAYATHKITNELCEVTVTQEIVDAEGWAKKSGSKWLTMPEQMYRYRSASWLANVFCPEVKLGIMSVDELEDIGEQKSTQPTRKPSNLEQRLTKPVEATITDSPAVAVEEPHSQSVEATGKDSLQVEAEPAEKMKEPRYFCKKCDIDVEESDMKGKAKNLCPNCLRDDNIVDREAPKI
jgi:hypothetical protein